MPRGRDCNDGDAAIRPGAAEAVNNDVDENCDGVKEYDRDGDGSRVPGNPADCDDNNPARSPLKPEDPGSAVDENCDNAVAPYPSIPSRVAPVFDTRKGIKLVSLSVFNSRKGSTLTIRCQGRGCRFGKKSVKITKAKKELRLEKRLTKRQRSFKPRQRLTFTLSGKGWSNARRCSRCAGSTSSRAATSTASRTGRRPTADAGHDRLSAGALARRLHAAAPRRLKPNPPTRRRTKSTMRMMVSTVMGPFTLGCSPLPLPRRN